MYSIDESNFVFDSLASDVCQRSVWRVCQSLGELRKVDSMELNTMRYSPQIRMQLNRMTGDNHVDVQCEYLHWPWFHLEWLSAFSDSQMNCMTVLELIIEQKLSAAVVNLAFDA